MPDHGKILRSGAASWVDAAHGEFSTSSLRYWAWPWIV
jgi:hypothetical protein